LKTFKNTNYKINEIREAINNNLLEFDYDQYLKWLFPNFAVDTVLVAEIKYLIS
jgi:hypothetical protein